MKISARPLHDHPVTIAPAPVRRDWSGASSRLFEDPTLQASTSRGWDLLCPYSFEAVWNGGSSPLDIEISAPGFVQSRVGDGILSFESGYQFDLEPGHDLWVRGPINHHKDGLQPLDQVFETDLLPCIGTVHWRFTRPGQVVRFERAEPFATLLPYPAGYIETFEGEVGPVASVDLPAVSCVCATYGRPELLEEAIESFLRQDYGGPKELLILNDLAEQVLDFDHPDVRIVNVPLRFRTLGEKLNATVALAAHDLIFVWNDDDISLPHRISLSVARLDPARGFFKASSAFFWNDGRLSGPEHNVFHGGSCWTRDLFVRVRGYPHETRAADQAIEALFDRARFDSISAVELSPEENYYIYRWSGTGSYHLSALGRDDPAESAALVEVGAHVAHLLQSGQLPRGRVVLQPRWRQDYVALTAAYLADRRLQPPEVPAEAAATPPPIKFGRLPQPVPEPEALGLFRGDAPVRMSVVLPSCNELIYLRRTVEQFRATLPPRSEIIVVDNGSTDGSSNFLADLDTQPADGEARLVDSAGGSDGVAIWLVRHAEPLGVAGARNRGLELARGEVVVFADAHVDVPPGWWPPMVDALNQAGVGIVGPAFTVIGAPEHGSCYGQRIADANLRGEWLPLRQEQPYPVPSLGGGFLAMRREVLAVTGAFDAGMRQWGSEDLEICLRNWLLDYEVWVVPDVEIPHYFRAQSPYQVEWKNALQNLMRTAFLHLNQERLARFLHAVSDHPQYARALALCVDSDVWQRRSELAQRRVHDDDWFFDHPHFRDIEMELRHALPS